MMIKHFQKNDSFETKLGEVYAPIIKGKITLEYARSFDYEPPEPAFAGSSVYKISLGGQTHALDNDRNYCDCLKIIYLGIPCKHLFRLWRFKGEKLFEKTVSATNPRWIIGMPSSISGIELSQSRSTSINLQSDITKKNSISTSTIEYQNPAETPKKPAIEITGGSIDLSLFRFAINPKIKNVKSASNSIQKPPLSSNCASPRNLMVNQGLSTNNSKRKSDFITKHQTQQDIL
jgi:hypothetical protein